MQNSFSIGKVKDIEIKIHYSWFLIFFLVVWSLAEFYFPAQHPGWGPKWIYWVSSSIAAFFLFLSVLFHEMSHSLVGKSSNVVVKSITLFVFGGVAEMVTEPKKPLDEFKMAAAGPLASFVLSAFFWVFAELAPVGETGAAIFYYLFLMNGVLAIFNLAPAFPLDGGRILRSALWKKYSDLDRATRYAVSVSKACAFLFTLWGIKMLFEDNFVGGLWVILISWFLLQAAGSSLKQERIEHVLSRIKAADLMDKNFKSVPPQMFLRDLAQIFLEYKQGGFPVEKNEKILGIITLEDLRTVPRQKWASTRISDIMTEVDKLQTIKPTDTAYDAFLKMTSYDVGRLPVLENGKVVGLVTRNAIILLLAVKCEKCV
jgi:Zn-dependent protease/CBS domain-containing protein